MSSAEGQEDRGSGEPGLVQPGAISTLPIPMGMLSRRQAFHCGAWWEKERQQA